MANDKFDNDIPNIVLDKEDREAFQRSRDKQKGKNASPPEPSQTVVKSSGSPGWAILAMLIAIGASGAALYLYQQSQSQSLTLIEAQQRISDLERRLSDTGEEMDQSAGALRVRVSELSDKSDELWDQMDKLWASAWRRNQTEIKTIQEAMSKQSREINSKFNVVESDTSTINTNFTVLQEKLEQQAKVLADLQIAVSEAQNDDNDNQRQIGDIQSKLVAVDQVNSALTRRIAELEKWRRTAASTATKSNSPPSVP